MLLNALTLGIRDFVDKSKAPGVLLGLSGGIDSALTAALAVRALGPQRVLGVRLPSRFSSQHALDDALQLATNLNIQLKTFSIEPLVQNFRAILNLQKNTSDQNLQARVRAVILMALSNETGFFLLSTSNKSELAMGYGTLYGDLCGALMPLGDVYKTQVWELARELNQQSPVIPENSISKAPSAELHENQLDQDSLPPYEVLDPILKCYLEQGKITENSEAIIQQIEHNEFKRKQAPPVLMVSKQVFTLARRMPTVKIM